MSHLVEAPVDDMMMDGRANAQLPVTDTVECHQTAGEALQDTQLSALSEVILRGDLHLVKKCLVPDLMKDTAVEVGEVVIEETTLHRLRVEVENQLGLRLIREE